MRTQRFKLALVSALAASVAAAACHGGRKASAHPPVLITVQVIDGVGRPFPGARLVATLGTEILDTALTGASGSAAIGVRGGGEITAYVAAGATNWAVTVMGISTASAATGSATTTLPLFPVLVPTSGVATPFTATFPELASIEVGVGSCVQNDLLTVGQTQLTGSIPVGAGCLQRDGTVSLWAVGTATSGLVTSYGAVLDQPAGTAAAVLLTNASLTGVTVSIFDVPNGVNPATFEVHAAALRSSQPLGPVLSDNTLRTPSYVNTFYLAGIGPGPDLLAGATVEVSNYGYAFASSTTSQSQAAFEMAGQPLPPAGLQVVEGADSRLHASWIGQSTGEWDLVELQAGPALSRRIYLAGGSAGPYDIALCPAPASLEGFVPDAASITQMRVHVVTADFASGLQSLGAFYGPPLPDTFTTRDIYTTAAP